MSHSSRKRHGSWRDKYASTTARHQTARTNHHSHGLESPYKKHKPSRFQQNHHSPSSSNTYSHTNHSNSNAFMKPSSALEREVGSNTNANQSGVVIYNRNHHKRIDIQRRTLPIYKHRDEILRSVKQYRTTILIGETGSGKTTQIPQYLHESGWTTNSRMICCTQPRRISTVSIANRVAKEQKDSIGNTVGYAIRFDSKVSAQTRIKFMTDGMLLSELLIDPLLSQYSVIILDEAHERSINIDLLLGLLKKILKIRLDLRLIVSSATMDAMKFKTFFTINDEINANILCVEGRTYPVEVFYLSSPCNNYVSCAVDSVINIHLTKAKGDILVFLTGEKEIMEACRQCENKMLHVSSSNTGNLLILPMYAGLSFTKQLKVFRKTNDARTRKVIFATNIAETSITIDGIVYVIDAGFVKLPAFDPLSGVSSLFVSEVSKACANQRKGRAGRITNGQCYRLYTEAIYNSDALNAYGVPEIQRSDLTECILKLKSLGIDNVLNFDFISPPPIIAITYALELLYALNVIDDNCKLTQPFGQIIAELPCDPRMGVMLVSSGDLKCSEEILSIAAMLTIKNIWVHKTMSQLQRAKQKETKLRFAVLEGDHLTYLNVFNSFILNNKNGNWCKENYLEHRSLKRAAEIRELLRKYLVHFKIPLVSCKEDAVSVLKCVVKGYFSNAAQIQPDGSYKTIRGNQKLCLHKSSILYSEAIPWVIFHEIIQTDSAYMHDVSAVKPTWLQQLASHFYQYKTLSHHKEREAVSVPDEETNKPNKKKRKKWKQTRSTQNKPIIIE
eukprot:267892_1